MALINPLVLIIFWNGALSSATILNGWTKTDINTYYLLLIITSTTLISHIEDRIAKDDIRDGGLVRYLTRPFSYNLFCFFSELPYQLIQGFFGYISFLILSHFINVNFIPNITAWTVLILLCGLVLSFLIQSTVALLAFWLTEIGGLFNTLEVVRLVLGGTILPLVLLPHDIAEIGYVLPFSYSAYFPITAIQGKLSADAQIGVLTMGLLWIAIFICLYRILWYFGVRKFSGVGQ